VLPLVPSYLSFVTGMSLEDLQRGVDRRNTLVHAALFVVGFTILFVLLQTSAFFLGVFLRVYKAWIARIGGVVLVLLGLHLSGVLRIAPLLRERRVHLRDKPTGYLGTVGVGMAFAAGWTPCIGPVLAGVIALASASEQLGKGVILLLSYSAGLGVPFLVSAVALERLLDAFQRFRRFMPWVQLASGVFLVFLGVLLVTGAFTVLTAYLYSLTPEFVLDFEYWLIDLGS
jgi:cytochrome c-type biogenesis protein